MTSLVNHHSWTIYLAFLCFTSILHYTITLSQSCSKNEDSASCQNGDNKYTIREFTDEELFLRGHLKPFGSHRPPDEIVEELPFVISPQDFYMKYVVKHKPVVIKGAVKRWPAYKLWTDEYLNHTYGDIMFNMETKDDDKVNIPKSMKLEEFLKIYHHADRYLVDEVPPNMRKDILLPLCLRCEEMDKHFFVSYFWFSQGNTSSTIHIDTDENMLCVVKGHKEVLMVSPEYSHDLHVDSSRILGVLDINVASVDMVKYPRVKNVHYVKANVAEGDMVYIPQMWWHQVYSRMGRQQAVAFWWKSKPRLKDGVRKSAAHQDHDQEEKTKVKLSYASILAEYEQWVQNVSGDQPEITCNEQHVLMSEYQFETDKNPDAEQTLGDGGDFEEEDEQKYKEIYKHVKQDYIPSQLPCDFDRENLKSPCYYKPCLIDDTELKCIRYMLDYCGAFQDRGCVIQPPMLLNKLGDNMYEVLKEMETDFD